MPTAPARYRLLVPICIAKWRTRHMHVPERTTSIRSGGVDKGCGAGIP